jgi:hypothetical protein
VTGGKKFRPLLSTEPVEWDGEERGCLLPAACILLALIPITLGLGYCLWVFFG